MKKFTRVNEEFEENLLRNKIENKTELSINITCDFCDFQDEYKCENNVANKEERWLAVETFIQNGWNELIVPKEKGIACPICVEKWEEGNWYVNENFDFNEEDFDEEEVNEKERIVIDRHTLRDIIYGEKEKDYKLIHDKITSSDPEDGGADHEVVINRKSDNKFFTFYYSDWDMDYNFERDFPENLVEVYPKKVTITIYE